MYDVPFLCDVELLQDFLVTAFVFAKDLLVSLLNVPLWRIAELYGFSILFHSILPNVFVFLV